MHEIITTLPLAPQEELPFQLLMAGISYCDGSYRISRQHSDIASFEYILQGNGVLETGGQLYYPVQGDVYLTHLGSDHTYYSSAEDPWIKLWFNVSGPLVANIVHDYGLSDVSLISNCPMKAPLQTMLRIAQRAARLEPHSLQQAALHFHRVVAQLSSFVHQSPAATPEAAQMKRFIDTHYNQRLSLNQIAAIAGRSRSQAIRCFKAAYGLTPYDYLMQCKLSHAKQFLSGSALPIWEIAQRLSFADEYYFSNYFKKKVGCSPSEYRKRSFVSNR